MLLDFAGQSLCGLGEHGRPGRVHRRLADEPALSKTPREAHGATREGARGPRDRGDSHAKSMEDSGRWYYRNHSRGKRSTLALGMRMRASD